MRRLAVEPKVESPGYVCVFLIVDIWKSFSKYHDFSFRLHTLDAGVSLGTILLVADRMFGFSCVEFDFPDEAVGDLLGLDPQREAVYAIISSAPLVGANNEWPSAKGRLLERAQDTLSAAPSKLVWDLHTNCCARFYQPGTRATIDPPKLNLGNCDVVSAERNSLDIGKAIIIRRSAGQSFKRTPVRAGQIASVVLFAVEKCTQDMVDIDGDSFPWLFVTIINVQGVCDGTYFCDVTAGSNDVRMHRVLVSPDKMALHEAILVRTVDMSSIGACFHIFGSSAFFESQLGPRGYRIQQMLAGVLASRIETAAYGLGLGSHILLGFDDSKVEDICGVDKAKMVSLAQVAVGNCHSELSLGGALSI
jgi:hypothetical protein